MYSFVIPTMWMSNRLSYMLEQYEADDNVQEVIIIDNKTESAIDLSPYKKVVHIPQEKNIFVNPAWNLGVSVAKSEYVVICNDDITFDSKSLNEFLLNEINESIIGTHPVSFYQGHDTMSIEDGSHVGYGWGVLMYMKKKNYIQIPDEFKIWFGDDILALNCGNVKSFITNIATEMSTTSSKEFANKTIHDDVLNLLQLTRRFNVYESDKKELQGRIREVWFNGFREEVQGRVESLQP